MRVSAGRRATGDRRPSGLRGGGRAGRLIACLCALAASACLLLFAAGTAGSTDRSGSVLAAGRGMAIEQLAPAAAAAKAPASSTGQSFGGVAAVGALFTSSDGKLGAHFCTASVVDSKAGDLAVTAAHCVYGRTQAMVFVPGYADGRTPYGVWAVTRVYTDDAWDAGQDPDHDVAFLRLSDAPDGAPIEDVTGAEALALNAPAGQPVQVIGYPDSGSRPLWCSGLAQGFSATQLEFDCGGYTVGTSGGPFLADVDVSTGQGTVIGVIGGYQQGGDTPQVSYAAVFGSAVAQLYATAEAAG
jgi:V8-like Glu-specific endopeptidase